MTLLLGNLALTLALVAAATGLLAAMAAARFGSAKALTAARWSVAAVFGGFSLAAFALIGALVDGDFRLSYVVRFTETALPTGYKLAAFWAGQEGSLLLWAWLIAGMAVIAGLVGRKQAGTEPAVTTGVLAVVCGFFAALMLFAANPFTVSMPAPPDGQGLNPMLQDPGMIAHPPLLFLGYAGFTIPLAMLFGALWAGRRDAAWLGGVRKWSMVAWVFLTAGILLGAQWAYVELGWGGYWAWDPVENASLLPWLTGTALLHSIMVQQRRGMLKGWNAVLIALTFALCILGTYITRSGIVGSVHSFGKSLVGTFFLAFLIATLVASAVLIVVRRRLLASEHKLESPIGQESATLAMNVLLVLMTAATTFGTLFPVISEWTGMPGSVGQPFYNKVVLPMGLCLMALMAFGPLLSYGRGAGERLGRRVVPAVAGGLGVAAVVAIACRTLNPWAIAAALIIGVAAVALLSDLVQTVARRIHSTRENPAVALVRTVDANHRRYGGQTIHIGMLMIMAGIVGSSVYGTKHVVRIGPGGSETLPGGWRVSLETFAEVRGPNYQAVEATVRVTEPSGARQTLRPQRRFYDKAENPSSEVANWSTLGRDAYLTLAGWEEGGRLVAFEMFVNPLVAWLWIGGIVIGAGSVVCLLPRLIPHGTTAAERGEVRPVIGDAGGMRPAIATAVVGRVGAGNKRDVRTVR